MTTAAAPRIIITASGKARLSLSLPLSLPLSLSLSLFKGPCCLRDLEPGTFLLDQTVKNIAVERLAVAIDNWKLKKQPFFVGMVCVCVCVCVCVLLLCAAVQLTCGSQGTHRPHLGWEFPIEYELPTAVVPEATHKQWPHDVPHLHYHECAEMASTYFDTTNFGRPFSQQNTQRSNFTNNQATLRRAYYGCATSTQHAASLSSLLI